MKMKLIIFVAVFLTACKGNVDKAQTVNFPKEEVLVESIPTKERLWVYIYAGQSNAAGRALVEPQDTISIHKIITINKDNQLIEAKEPIHFYEPSMSGLGSGLSFAKTLLKKVPDSITVLILPTAVGGSSISQWLGDSTHRGVTLFKNFTEKVKLANDLGTLKGIIWHQGETDADFPADIASYGSRLSQLIEKFRLVAGNPMLPVVIGELGSFSNNGDGWQKINNVIKTYADSGRNIYLVETSDLKDKGDKVHFDSQSQRLIGERFAEILSEIELGSSADNR